MEINRQPALSAGLFFLLFGNLLKEQSGHKLQRCKVQTDQSIDACLPSAVIPGTHPAGPQPHAGQIFCCEDQYHVQHSMTHKPVCRAQGQFSNPAVNSRSYGRKQRPHSIDRKHQKRSPSDKPPVMGQHRFHRGKHYLQAPSSNTAFKKING